MYAAINGFTNSVEFLAHVAKVNVNASDNYKRTALHWCARYRNPAMV